MDSSEHVQSLPKELYDWIYELVFTAGSTGWPIRVRNSYRPPAMLQVSRASRQKFATSYYGSSNGFKFRDEMGMRKWLKSLEYEEKVLLQEIIYKDGYISETLKGPFSPFTMVDDILEKIDEAGIDWLDDHGYGGGCVDNIEEDPVYSSDSDEEGCDT